MGRSKRTSAIVEAARLRLAQLKSINPVPDFGGDLTVPGFEAEINSVNTDLEGYNQDISNLDEKKNRLETRERKLQEIDTRFLSAIRAKHGPDSDEYEKAGGTRRSDRKRPGPKKKSGTDKT